MGELTDKRDKHEVYFNSRVMLDFLNHFLWWNVDFIHLAAKNEVKVKSTLVQEFLQDIDGSNFRLIISCLQWINTSTNITNLPMKKVCWLLYLCFIHLFGVIEEE